jgi:hypothetical protein
MLIGMPSQSEDRAAAARAALQRSFIDQAGGDREEAERLKREFYARLGRRSGVARRTKASARAAAEQATLAELGFRVVTEAELLTHLRRSEPP